MSRDTELVHDSGNLEGQHPSATTRQRTRLDHSQIISETRVKAFFIGEKRKMLVLLQQIRELQDIAEDPGRIHSIRKSTPEEQLEDWQLALTCFASDVLNGRTSFPDQLGAQSWRELENVPLEEVKRLDAYFISRKDSRSDDPIGCYLEACRGLNKALLDRRMKHNRSDFAEVRKFLTADRGCYGPFLASSIENRAIEELKDRKASMRYQHRLGRGEPGSAIDDWKAACEYTSLFYGNVLGAIEGEESTRTERLKNALSAFGSPWREKGMVNSFEAVIAIYFFSPDAIDACWPDKSSEKNIL